MGRLTAPLRAVGRARLPFGAINNRPQDPVPPNVETVIGIGGPQGRGNSITAAALQALQGA